MWRFYPKPWVEGYLRGYSSDTYGKEVCVGYTRGHGYEGICEVIVVILTERKYAEVIPEAMGMRVSARL
jgi:hypothetical protein